MKISSPRHSYAILKDEDASQPEEEMAFLNSEDSQDTSPTLPNILPFKRIFTKNLCCTIAAQAIMEAHMSTFHSIWSSFLSEPVADPTKDAFDPPFRFIGGLGMPARDVGRATAFIGIFGIAVQLFVYTKVVEKIGTRKAWRIFLWFFPMAYALAPYLSILPSRSAPPAEKDGPLIWICVAFIQLMVVTGGTFVLPAQLTLTNK